MEVIVYMAIFAAASLEIAIIVTFFSMNSKLRMIQWYLAKIAAKEGALEETQLSAQRGSPDTCHPAIPAGQVQMVEQRKEQERKVAEREQPESRLIAMALAISIIVVALVMVVFWTSR